MNPVNTRNIPEMITTQCVGLLLSAMIVSGCGGQPRHVPGAAADSLRSFTARISSAKYSGVLTRVEYKGKLVYDKYCQVCHGKDGDGRGFNAFNLHNSFGVQPADFTDSAFTTGLTKQTMMKVIGKGGASLNKSQYMPPWGKTLESEEIDYVISFIRTFRTTKSEKSE